MLKKSQAANDTGTIARLLDASERLFGQYGYDGVGMRMLADQAGVNLNSATYHFGTKEALYIETFMRRFRPVNAERLRLLKEAESKSKGGLIEVDVIVDCLIRPPYLQGLEHPDFHTLLGRNLITPPAFLEEALKQEMEPNIRLFNAALVRALPNLPKELVHLRVMFGMGALPMLSMHMVKMGAPRDPKRDECVLKELIRFISAGLKSEPAVPNGRFPAFHILPKLSRK